MATEIQDEFDRLNNQSELSSEEYKTFARYIITETLYGGKNDEQI